VRVQSGRGWRVVAAACVLALLPMAASAQTGELRDGLEDIASERDRIEAEVGELREREGDARQRLAAVDAELSEAEDRLAALRDELEAAEAALAEAEAALARATAAMAEVAEELLATETELAAATAKLEARVIAAYKYGQVSLTEVFAGVRDFSDLISSSVMVSHVLDSDRIMVTEVERLLTLVGEQRAEAQALREEAEREAAAAEAAAASIEDATRSQTEVLATIERQREEREQLFLELRDDRSAAEGHLAGLEAESARIESQLAAIAREQAAEEARRQQAEAAAAAEEARRRQAEEAARRAAEEAAADPADDAPEQDQERTTDEGTPAPAPSPSPAPPPASGGGSGGSAAPAPSPTTWVRPAAGPLTSPFGPRWGRNHNGVDIGGAVGSTVVASRPGTVVSVIAGCHPTSSWGCGGGFGNYVTIAHSGGMATIYAHLASSSVHVGQQVGAGQTVGGIGNSGNSYGPHLHFEVREAGVPRNPCNYIAC
jgi:murein DD-endopeptidase MepM/ murein hydrolase activator NlpD